MRTGLLFAVFALPIAGGCEFAAKQTFFAAEGIQSRTMEIHRPVGNFAFDRYRVVEVEKFTSRLEGLIPARVTDPVQTRVVRNITEANLFADVAKAGDARMPDQPGLVVRGTFIDFHPGAGLNRTVAFGGEGLLTALVSIDDRATGVTLWRGHVSGFLRATISGKLEELGEGIGEAIEAVVEQYHSPVKGK